MYILYNQLPLYVCVLWKKNKYSFFLSYLHEFSKKFETVLMGYSGAVGKLMKKPEAS